MASFKIDGFVTAVVGICVAIVVFAMVAIPVITEATDGMTGNLKTIVEVIPIFIAIGILMACIYLFIQRKG